MVTKELGSSNTRLRETAWWIASRHPEWGSQLSGFVHTRLADAMLTPAERDDLLQQLVRLARSPAIQRLLAEQAADAKAPQAARQLALQAMAKTSLKVTPTAWLTALPKVLTTADAKVLREAVTTARACVGRSSGQRI